jgi:hypothetical protein
MATEMSVFLVEYRHGSGAPAEATKKERYRFSLHVAAADVPSALRKAEADAKRMKHTALVFVDCRRVVDSALV